MKLLDDIYKERCYRVVHLLPLPLWYRLPPSLHRALLQLPQVFRPMPVDDAPLPVNAHGRIWGVPYIVSAAVPEDCVMFTTDFEEWQSVTVGP